MACVAIRPETLVFGDGIEGRVNRLTGVVTEATFLGNIVDYQVDIGGLTLRVQGDRRSFATQSATGTLNDQKRKK
jgi:hypothetical protein